MYKRIFPGPIIRAAIWVMFFIVLAGTISFCFAQVFECTPVSIGGFNKPGTRCIDVIAMTYALGLTGALTDFALMVMPWPGLWRLQMPPKQKAAVIGVFMLGSL